MNETDALLQSELELGEILCWSGRPSAVTLSLRMLPVLAFGTVWTGGMSAFLFVALTRGPSLISPAAIGAAVFLCFGLVIFYQPLRGLVEAHRIHHGITNRRILTVVNSRRRKVASWGSSQITGIERRDRAGGREDIIFHQSYKAGVGGTDFVSAALIDITDARTAEALIRRLSGGQ